MTRFWDWTIYNSRRTLNPNKTDLHNLDYLASIDPRALSLYGECSLIKLRWMLLGEVERASISFQIKERVSQWYRPRPPPGPTPELSCLTRSLASDYPSKWRFPTRTQPQQRGMTATVITLAYLQRYISIFGDSKFQAAHWMPPAKNSPGGKHPKSSKWAI